MGNVLVIGSTLLDIIATYDEENDSNTSKIGWVRYSVGGAAFNIAANLTVNGIPSSIFTYLSRSSLGSQVIQLILKNTRINTKYITYEDMGQTTYVAHYCGKDLKSGVTSSAIDQITLNSEKLVHAINEADIIAIDTNLSTEQIEQILNKCVEFKNKRVLAMIVSTPKAERIANKNFAQKFELVSMNAEEADRLSFKVADQMDAKEIIQFCKKLNTVFIFVTKGKQGYCILYNDGRYKNVRGWGAPDEIKNDLGAGDALFSALCASAFLKHPYDSNETSLRIREWVNRVLQRHESNMLSISSISERPKPSVNRQKNTYLVALFFIAILSVIIGTFSKSITPIEFWSCFFICAICCGTVGGLIRNNVDFNFDRNETQRQLNGSMIYGLIAGVASALLFLVPHFTIGDRAERLRESVDGLNIVIIWVFPIALGAGLAFEVVINGLRKNGIELIKKEPFIQDPSQKS